MFYKLRNSLGRLIFDVATKNVIETPPIPRDCSGPIFLTMLRSKDLNMYLVAVKSLARFLLPSRVVVVDDGLTENDRHMLQAAIGDVEIPGSSEFIEKSCPTGGCWERLLAISHYVNDGFVMQVDADTLTIDDPVEVRDAVANKQCFTLGTESGREFRPLEEFAEMARRSSSRHVQVLAEQVLDSIPCRLGTRYVRGCAGFAGFAQGMLELDRIVEFSTFMESKLGDIWHSWGSEQVTSNFMVANAASGRVLPVDGYVNYRPDKVMSLKGVRFCHFIGSHRYSSGHLYTRLARRLVRDLTGNMSD